MNDFVKSEFEWQLAHVEKIFGKDRVSSCDKQFRITLDCLNSIHVNYYSSTGTISIGEIFKNPIVHRDSSFKRFLAICYSKDKKVSE